MRRRPPAWRACGTEPRAPIRSRISGSASTRPTSVESWFTIARGVFAGANMPYHWSQSRPAPRLPPARARRAAPASARTCSRRAARSLPSLIMPSTLPIGAKAVCTRPVAVSVEHLGHALVGNVRDLDAGREPELLQRHVRAAADAGEAKLIWPGFCFAAAISSFAVLMPCEGATTSTLGALVSCETPAKSRTVSKGSFA